MNWDYAAAASAREQCFLALAIFPAAVSRGRFLAPVDVFYGVRAPSRTWEIAASSHLDLAHRSCDVFIAAIDGERDQAEQAQMSRAERWRAEELWRLWVSSSLNRWTMRPVAAVNGSPRAGELRTQ